MDYEGIKRHANAILASKTCECSYIEYKASPFQKDKILKTICAYGNNYYDNDIQYIFIGVEEMNDDDNKAIPKLPLDGIDDGSVEKWKNSLMSLRPYLYPNVTFDLISNEMDGKKYILLVVTRQTGGPFMVSEKAERDKRIHLKAGRYVRIEAETRLARVDEEYDLLRKFSNYHYTSLVNSEASLDDLDISLIREYLAKTSERNITSVLNKTQISESLGLLDRNDPTLRRVKNFAILMFSNNPEKYIPYAYVEMIVDMFGTKRKMESKTFKGPLWKIYNVIVDYIDDNFLNTIVIRENGISENRRISNYTYTAVEELVANAIVHNNYENEKPIQIYISQTEIDIVNYNKPLPPLTIRDLNHRTVFNERDTENPEIRDMFKAIGIIESFGTGIGEAKRSMKENGSPALYYKEFDDNYNATSVVIPINPEYLKLKTNMNPNNDVGIVSETQVIKNRILNSSYSRNVKSNMIRLYDSINGEVFGNSQIAAILKCSETTATAYIKKLTAIGTIQEVAGHGKGKYRFVSE